MRVACILLEQNQKLADFAESCLRFTPQLALGERAVFLEIGACQKLYREETWLLRAQNLLRRFELKAKLSIANDIPTALAFATFGISERARLPVEALQIYASPFKASLSLEKTILALKQLGLTELSQVLTLPRASLGRRFSKELLFAIHSIDASTSLPWPRYIPPEKIIEERLIDEDYQIKHLEPLLFVLRGLADRALLRLRSRGALASVVQIILIQEKFSHTKELMRSFKLDLALPQSSVVSLLPILAEHLDRALQREPLEAAVRSISFEIIKSVPGKGRQVDFLSKREEELENFRGVVARLTERLGFDRAFMASMLESYFPERSWKKTLDEPQELASPLPERPLRILREAQALQRLDDFLFLRRRRWKIKAIQGPERLSGEWWFKEKERDYFRVLTEEGEELWVYSLPQDHTLFLHGIFD